ncbi:hypothetical protein Emag_001654 [Eimeria magna]
MPAATEADAFGYKSIHLVATEERSGVHRKDSPKTELISGEKYRIRIELVHSNHLKYKTPDTGVFRLDSKVFDSAFLRDGVQPFVDDKSHYLVDIPLRYHGRRMLRSLSQPNIDSFAVELNVPAILYVASFADEPLPLEPSKDASWTVHDSHESMTLLSGVDASGRALEAKRLSIKFISLRSAGGTNFKVAHTAIPFIIFVEPRKDEAFSCDAEEEVLSLVGGPVLAECEASSEKPGGFDCNSGLNGKHMDRRFGTWKTKGTGTWYNCELVNKLNVDETSRSAKPLRTHFRFKPLDDQLLWPSQITLSYSEGRVYGTSPFAPGSTVCTSGIFAGICKAALESECSLLVTVGGRKTTFKRDTANDIEALEHGPSDASYTLAKAPCDSIEDEKPPLYFTFGSEMVEACASQQRSRLEGTANRSRSGVPLSVESHVSTRRSTPSFCCVFSEVHLFSSQDCTPNFWSVVLAHNGVYQVEALLAVPFESQYGSAPTYLQVNGVSIAHGAVVPKGRVFGGAATVEVTEKLIDVASICKDAACGVEPTMLLSLSISYIGPLPGHDYEKDEE